MLLATYHPAECNIASCGSPQHKLFMCQAHFKRYVDSDQARVLMEEVYALSTGAAPTSLVRKARLNNVVHYLTNLSVPYVEHFPLESLFLYHRDRLLSQSATDAPGRRFPKCREFKQLLEDFAYPTNQNIAALRTRYAQLCDDTRFLYSTEHRIADHLRELMLFSPSRYLVVATIAVVLLSALSSAEVRSRFNSHLPEMLTPTWVTVAYLACVGIVVGGAVFLRRIDPVLNLAGQHKLYVSSEENREAIAVAATVRGRFDSRAGLDYTVSSMTLTGLMFSIIPVVWAGGLSPWEALVTALAFTLVLVTVYPLLTVHNLYANASVAMEALPTGSFKVDLYAADGRLGLGELVELVYAGLLYNATHLAIFWLAIPVMLRHNKLVLVVYLVLVPLFAIVRVTQLRRLLRVRRAVTASIGEALAIERKRVATLPVAERVKLMEQLNGVRQLPLIPFSTLRKIGYLVTTVGIPLLLLALDKLSSVVLKAAGISAG